MRDEDDKDITITGLLSTMETILFSMEGEGRSEVQFALEPVILQAIHHIFTNSILEYYEEAISLSGHLTRNRISSDMWRMLGVMYNEFQRDEFDLDFFSDMMPVLHNYITVDTQTFLSSPDYMMAIYNMCKTILERDPGEDLECFAAKLLEVIILQCKGMNIDQAIPIIVELVLKRLAREGRPFKTSELRTMCLMVIIAALYYNPTLLLDIMEKIQIPGIQDGVFRHFLHQWTGHARTFLGIHDRKLSILGLVLLLQMPDNVTVKEQAKSLVPIILNLFEGLTRAYDAADDPDDDDDDDDGDSDESNSDSEAAGGESSFSRARKALLSNEDEDNKVEEAGHLEGYTTPLDDNAYDIDEYTIFYNVLGSIQKSHPAWHARLTGRLSEQTSNVLNKVLTLAEARSHARVLRQEEKAGKPLSQEKQRKRTLSQKDQRELCPNPKARRWAHKFLLKFTRVSGAIAPSGSGPKVGSPTYCQVSPSDDSPWD